jgi:diguanylate cyclase (GGDEF)-like protein/PAS domain S-box-containing protein
MHPEAFASSMTPLLLVSAGLLAILGGALLLLWRQERSHLYVRHWGWSWVLLAAALTAGPLLQDLFPPGTAHNAQALLASTTLMGSQLLQLAGTLDYGGRRLRLRLWLPGFVLITCLLAALGSRNFAHAVLCGAGVLLLNALACAALLWRASRSLERWVSICFMLSGLVHMSSPLLDPLGRSAITYGLGLIVQTVLCLGLVLLSVGRAHQQARLQAQRFTRLAEHSLQGLAVLREHQILYANPAARAMFGRSNRPDNMLGDTFSELVLPELREAARQRHRQVLADPQARIEWEGQRLGFDGRLLHVRGLSSHLEWDGQPAELLAMLDDSARHAALEALRRQALHDELTDLPNRNYAVERLQQLTRLGAPPFALVSADLDRFQLVNESLGHAMGDALLQAIAQRLCSGLPPTATLARLGEDQFVMLVEGVPGRTEALGFVEQLLALMERPFALERAELFVHMSVGVALFPEDGGDGPALLRAADSAMHRAKASAGATYAFFDAAMNRAAQARMEAEQALSRALEEGEFRLEYQPKMRAVSRELCGFEALVRWQRPGVGPVSPADFVPAAERTGQIKALGALIVDMATAQLRQWQERFGRVLPVAINVSPLQFDDPEFVPRLLAALHQQQLPCEALQIEITETAAIGHVERVLPQLERLRTAGVLCALDDFGTGQSSLTMLRQLPIHAMKLDRSMIAPLPQRDASAVVQATCALGHSLGLEIIAEGVETEEQAMAVEALGCTQLQGYYLSRPLSAERATEMLRRFVEINPPPEP